MTTARIILSIVVFLNVLLLAFLLYVSWWKRRRERLHVDQEGNLVNGFKTGFGGRKKDFNEADIYQ